MVEMCSKVSSGTGDPLCRPTHVRGGQKLIFVQSGANRNSLFPKIKGKVVNKNQAFKDIVILRTYQALEP